MNYWIHRLLPVLRAALDALGVLPERDPTHFAQAQGASGKAPRLIIDATERRLASEVAVRQGVPGIPFLNVEGPRPAGTAWVWTRDSLDWSGAETVGDLLLRVPGLFLVRGGWIGRPELPSYLGRSAASVEAASVAITGLSRLAASIATRRLSRLRSARPSWLGW